VQICGIDDAGRGALLGPLVIAGVSLEKKNLRKLTSLGVKDSKKLSPKYVKIYIKKLFKPLTIIMLQKFLHVLLMLVLGNTF